MGGFLGAVLDDDVETARRRALATPGSRLQPPLGLILDEIANMFSWPALPRVMADGGASDVGHLKDLEALLGTRRVRETGHTYHQAGSTTSVHEQLVPVMTVDELRRMPEATGLLAYRTHRGILLDLKGWTQRRDAEQITAGKTSTEAEQQVVFTQKYQDAVARRRKQGQPR